MRNCKRRQTVKSVDQYCFVIVTIILLSFPVVSGDLLAQPTLKDVVERPSDQEELDEGAVPTQKVKSPIPDDEFGRGTPRTSVKSFFEAIEEKDFERAAEYLDLRNLPKGMDKGQGPDLARKLRIVLAQTIWVDYAMLNIDPAGHLDDGLPEYRDRIGRIKSDKKTFDILLQKVPRGDGVFIWKFSNRTVGQIPELYATFGHGFLDKYLPAWFFDYRVLEIYVWEWASVLVLAVILYIAVWGFTAPIVFLMRRKETPFKNQLIRLLLSPVRLLMWAFIGRYIIGLLNISLVLQAVMQAGTLFLIIIGWAAMRTIDFFTEQMAARLRQKGQSAVTVLFGPLANGLKVVIVLSIFILWLDNLGVQVTTLLTGLGIGGIAVALAAQKSLENFFGAITLYASRPVRVGDFCRFGDRVGTVEEIGLRSTLVRTLDHSILNVPNSEFSNLHLENYSKREKMWYHPRIRLRYETTPDQLRYILVEVRKLLYSHPKVLIDPARIRFTEFGEYSLDLEIFAYIDVTDYGQYLEVAEDLNLRIMEIVGQAGSGFAYPSQRLYVERGKGVDEERAREAEGQVKEWREGNELFLPSFPPQRIQELHGSLDYPPLGSPDAVART